MLKFNDIHQSFSLIPYSHYLLEVMEKHYIQYKQKRHLPLDI